MATLCRRSFIRHLPRLRPSELAPELPGLRLRGSARVASAARALWHSRGFAPMCAYQSTLLHFRRPDVVLPLCPSTNPCTAQPNPRAGPAHSRQSCGCCCSNRLRPPPAPAPSLCPAPMAAAAGGRGEPACLTAPPPLAPPAVPAGAGVGATPAASLMAVPWPAESCVRTQMKQTASSPRGPASAATARAPGERLESGRSGAGLGWGGRRRYRSTRRG